MYSLKNVSKKYEINNNEYFYALKNVSLELPSFGITAIVGKSGSGKSTLLNLISLIDVPSEGEIYFKNRSIEKFSSSKKANYLLNDIGIVFQDYQLLDDETVLYNVSLPLLMKGLNNKKIILKVNELFKKFNFSDSFKNKKINNLSGGEKQRVAIMRAIIKEPSALMCDEPTGALDSENSLLVMDMLKKISEECLVVIISHNNDLVNKYADQIITISDGKIIQNIKNSDRKLNDNFKNFSSFTTRKSSWINHVVYSNFKNRIVKNIFTISAYSFALTCAFIVIGFSFNSKNSIINESLKQFDYGTIKICKEITKNIENSILNVTHQTRPSNKEILNIKNQLQNYIIETNLDYFINSSGGIKVGDKQIDTIQLVPIYSFEEKFVNKSLLLDGKIPKIDTFKNVVVNKAAYKILKDNLPYEPLFRKVGFDYSTSCSYFEEYSEIKIDDIFVINTDLYIDGVVDDMNFLETPKIYYSYIGACEYLQNLFLNNLSTYFDRPISWYERINEMPINDTMTSFSYYGFLKNIDDIALLKKDVLKNKNEIIFISPCLEREEALLNLINAASMGMELFLFLIISGAIFILATMSLSSYTQDKKRSAILSSLGAKNNDINAIYVYENFAYIIIALFIAFIITPLVEKITNLIILKSWGYNNMVGTIFNFDNKNTLILLVSIVASFLIAILSTFIPITFSKKISIKDEFKTI